jgi:hypothetical protein
MVRELMSSEDAPFPDPEVIRPWEMPLSNERSFL